jgi:hypothetical protein
MSLKRILVTLNHYLYPPRNYLALTLKLINFAFQAQGRLSLRLGWPTYVGMAAGACLYLTE